MRVEYRRMRPEDAPAIIPLWVDANPGTNSEQWQREWQSIAHGVERTHVAVLPDGSLISTAHFSVRALRDRDGTPRRVGVISHVATRPDARRQGHATRLIELTLEAMKQQGCEWSLLFTSDMARSLYTRLGWCGYPRSFLQGTLCKRSPHQSPEYTVRRVDPGVEADGWGRLAEVYSPYNATRPLSLVRDLSYWRSEFSRRVRGWEGAFFLAAGRPGCHSFDGYLLAHCSGSGFLVAEIGVRPEGRTAMGALLEAVAAEASRQGARGGRLHLPDEPAVTAALEPLLAVVQRGQSSELMARPLAEGWDEARLQALCAASGAMSWLMDDL